MIEQFEAERLLQYQARVKSAQRTLREERNYLEYYVAALFEAGHSYMQIGSVLGVPSAVVSRYIKAAIKRGAEGKRYTKMNQGRRGHTS